MLEKIKEGLLPIIASFECHLDSMEYVKEKGEWYLRVFIEKNDGNLDMDTCVAVSEAVSEKLDELDLIKDEYYLEVSSPGIEKPLKTFEQVEAHVGSYVHIDLKNPKNGIDSLEGTLASIDGQELLIQYMVKAVRKKMTINYDDIKFIRLAVKFQEVKNYSGAESIVDCKIDDDGKIRIFTTHYVVDDVNDEDFEYSIEEAQEIDPKYQVGDEVVEEADISEFGRLAAIQTKQLLRQKIREAEKEALYNEYINKLDEIINGTVDRVEERFAIINIGKTGALLSSKVYVSEVERTTKGTHISVSRTHEGLVKRLFEMEVPEIFEGTVEIKSVSREAGERSKIAVYTANPDIDPIGACVGPVTFISHALSPAKVERVKLNHSKNSALVVVPDDQLSLAIGKRGQNARLAVKLTNWKIDIKSVSEILEEGIDLDAPEVDMELLEKMKKSMEEHEADEEKESIILTLDEDENEEDKVEEDLGDDESFDDEDDSEEPDHDPKYDEDIDYDQYDEYYEDQR